MGFFRISPLLLNADIIAKNTGARNRTASIIVAAKRIPFPGRTFRLLALIPTASMVVLNGLGIWNDFLMPYLVLPSDRAKTITVEVYSFVGQYTARWDIVFAGTVCSIIPALIIFVLLQKYFVKGITAGAAKG